MRRRPGGSGRAPVVARAVVAACLAGLGIAAWPAGGTVAAAQTVVPAGERGAAEAAERRRELRGILRTAVPGSGAHRAALAGLVRLEAATPGGAAGADSLLRAWARRYGPRAGARAPSDAGVVLARLAVGVSRAWGRDGGPERAAAALGIGRVEHDPAAGAILDARRAELALQAGAGTEARDLLRGAAAVAGAGAARRSRWIALLGALEAAEAAEERLLGEALARLERDPAGVGAEELLEGWLEVPGTPARPALLAWLGEELDARGRTGAATDVRLRILERHPDTPEAAAALLALGRAATGRDTAEATRWLERLVLEHPESPSAPEARRLLSSLRGGG